MQISKFARAFIISTAHFSLVSVELKKMGTISKTVFCYLQKTINISLTKAGVKHHTSHEPNRMLMRENNGFPHLHSIRLMLSTAFDQGLSFILRSRKTHPISQILSRSVLN